MIVPEPEPIGTEEERREYAGVFGVPVQLVNLAHRCPTCEAAVLVCDNGVWLDARPVAGAAWCILKVGSQSWGAVGDGDAETGSTHTLHEHQP